MKACHDRGYGIIRRGQVICCLFHTEPHSIIMQAHSGIFIYDLV